MKIDVRVAKCLCNLQGPEFAPLLEYLKALREEARDTLEVNVDNRVIHANQGRAQLLKQLLADIDNARTLVNNLERR